MHAEIIADAPWAPDSWRSYPAMQQPKYPDPAALESVSAQLKSKPPLVAVGEIQRLRNELAAAAAGDRFLLQGGDCAERFEECTGPALKAKFQILLQMSLILTYATRRPVIRLGRIAGQYAKPRSSATERVNGHDLPAYRGDLINDLAATPESRQPDPRRMLEGYHHAAATLNFIRALIEGGFADLHHPEYWDLQQFRGTAHGEVYQRAVEATRDALNFIETIGAGPATDAARRISFYTSHEALLLPYEEGLTRRATIDGKMYNLGAHLLWLGYRTYEPDGAHAEYLRGIENPLAIKVGAGTDADKLLALLERLDPQRTPGRLTLISRFGAGKVESHLAPLAACVAGAGHPVLWVCDPMHGNTQTSVTGRKTRPVPAIFAELEEAFRSHEAIGSRLGGVHFEMTAEEVTECTGGAQDLRAEDLGIAYRTACDPRLNGSQALEMAVRIAQHLRRQTDDQIAS